MTPEYWALRGQFLSDAELALHLLDENKRLRLHVEQLEIKEQLLMAQRRQGEANGRNARDGRTRARELPGLVRAAGSSDST